MGLISLMSLLLKSNFILKRVNYFNDAAVWCYDPPAHYFTELFFTRASKEHCVALHIWLHYRTHDFLLSFAVILNGNQSYTLRHYFTHTWYMHNTTFVWGPDSGCSLRRNETLRNGKRVKAKPVSASAVSVNFNTLNTADVIYWCVYDM